MVIQEKATSCNDADLEILIKAEAALSKTSKTIVEWGVDPVPDEPIPPKNSHRSVGSQLLYTVSKLGRSIQLAPIVNYNYFCRKY